MAYKKYINRNGKLYGPYEYESKRVDGKVITEYHGAQKPNKFRKFLLIIGAFVFILILILFLTNIKKTNSGFSGKSVLELDADYKEGEILNGKLDISLNNGELIPADSKLVLQNSNVSYDFLLREIISEKLSEGDFYISGKELSGSGEGYGKEGNAEFYPEVYFKLNIYSLENEEEITETPTEIPEEVQEVVEEIFNEPSTETNSESEELTETQNVPITGNAISRFFGLTGRATVEKLQKEIDVVISKDRDYELYLEEGESYTIELGSVRTASGNLDNNEIIEKKEGNKVIFKTDYSEKKNGFGSDYLEDNPYKISVDLNKLNLNLEKGDLNVKIVYEDEELLLLNAVLDEEIIVNDTISEIPVEEEPEEEEEIIISDEENDSLNISKPLNQSNQTIEVSFEETKERLTIQEKAALLSAFGNTSVEVIKSELFKERIIIGYKLGNYEIEYSYDFNISNETLENEMEKDRIKWLKDIANSLLQEEPVHEEINLSNSTYNF